MHTGNQMVSGTTLQTNMAATRTVRMLLFIMVIELSGVQFGLKSYA